MCVCVVVCCKRHKRDISLLTVQTTYTQHPYNSNTLTYIRMCYVAMQPTYVWQRFPDPDDKGSNVAGKELTETLLISCFLALLH